MKHLLFTFAIVMLSATTALGQDNNSFVVNGSAPTKKDTKYEKFVSRAGVIHKFYDEKMPKIASSWGPDLETKLRVFINEENQYYYQLEQEEKIGKTTTIYYRNIASVAYEDLIEINRAIEKLLKEVDQDCKTNREYLENYFLTSDGLEIGYYVKGTSVSWFIKLERYRDDFFLGKTIFPVKSPLELQSRFKDAQMRIEELKNKNK